MAEIAAAGIAFGRAAIRGRPVIGQLDLAPSFVARRGEEDQREAALLAFDAADFLQPEQLEEAMVASGSVTRIIVWRYSGMWLGLHSSLVKNGSSQRSPDRLLGSISGAIGGNGEETHWAGRRFGGPLVIAAIILAIGMIAGRLSARQRAGARAPRRSRGHGARPGGTRRRPPIWRPGRSSYSATGRRSGRRAGADRRRIRRRCAPISSGSAFPPMRCNRPARASISSMTTAIHA